MGNWCASLVFRLVVYGCLYNQALADARSTGAIIECLYCIFCAFCLIWMWVDIHYRLFLISLSVPTSYPTNLVGVHYYTCHTYRHCNLIRPHHCYAFYLNVTTDNSKPRQHKLSIPKNIRSTMYISVYICKHTHTYIYIYIYILYIYIYII